MNESDETLLREFVAGKHASFELLVRRHTHELYRFAYRMTGSSVNAEDVVQDSFLQVFVSAAEFDSSRRFKPWLFTVAGNKARDLLRKEKRRRELPVDAPIDDDDESGRRFVDLLSTPGAGLDDEIGLEERRPVVREVLEAMPLNLKEMIVLAYYHHFSYKEIGGIVGIPMGTVKSRLHWAITEFGERYLAAVAERVKRRRLG